MDWDPPEATFFDSGKVRSVSSSLRELLGGNRVFLMMRETVLDEMAKLGWHPVGDAKGRKVRFEQKVTR